MNRILLISTLLILLTSCGREPVDTKTFSPPVINPSSKPAQGGLVGIITTTGNLPVEDASVNFNGEETMTDSNGKFSFENGMLYRDGTYVKVEKPGYLFGSRKIYALDGEINVADVELIPAQQGMAVNSSQASLVEEGNLQVNFPTGDYQLSANENYNGGLFAQLTTIDASKKNSYNKMPGDLTGVNSSYEVKALSNFGVFHVNLTSQLDEQIQLPTDSKAQFKLKLTDADYNPLPSVVSVYHFDELNGTWIEKGEASLVNETYEGEIDVVGYWMLGQSYNYTDIEGAVGSSVGNIDFSDTEIEILNREDSYLNAIRTTKTGKYATRVPQDVNLDLAIFHECAIGNQIENIGSVSQSETIEVIDFIEIDNNMDNISIAGNITDCNGEVQDGSFVKISFSEQQYLYRTDENGNFNHSFSSCSETNVSIRAINEEDSKISDPLDVDISNVINIGDIQTCNEVVAGYDIDYVGMDWGEALANNVDHSWTISRISGVNGRTIFSAKMIDSATGTIYLKAAFVITDGETTADYQITFSTQSFHLFGECDVEVVEYGDFSSYRFFGVGDDIAEIDSNIYPGNIDFVNFDMVYYD